MVTSIRQLHYAIIDKSGQGLRCCQRWILKNLDHLIDEGGLQEKVRVIQEIPQPQNATDLYNWDHYWEPLIIIVFQHVF